MSTKPAVLISFLFATCLQAPVLAGSDPADLDVDLQIVRSRLFKGPQQWVLEKRNTNVLGFYGSSFYRYSL